MAEYTVKGGQTLSGILKEQGYADYKSPTLWNSVASASGIANPNLIRPGQVLQLPGLPVATPTPAPTPVQAPQTANQVDPYLQNLQTQLAAQASQPAVKSSYEQELEQARTDLGAMQIAPETDEQRMARIQGMITPDMARPEIPSLRAEFFELREQYGITGLEEQATQLQDDIYAIENRLRERVGLEENKAVNLNVIAGRISEVERQEMTRLDYLNRSATRLNNQITSANNMVSTIMQLTQTDYENARTAYNDQLQQKLETYKLFSADKESERDFNLRIMSSKLELSEKLYEIEQHEIQKAQDMARANLEIMTNAITAGNIKYADMDMATKAQISKMEAQAGLPIGFTSKLQSTQPDAEIISTTSRQDASGMNYVDVITRDRITGEMKVTSQATGASPLPKTGSSGSTSKKKVETVVDKYMGKARAIVNEVNASVVDKYGLDSGASAASDNYLSIDEINLVKNRILEMVGDRAEAMELFDAVMADMNMQLWEG